MDSNIRSEFTFYLIFRSRIQKELLLRYSRNPPCFMEKRKFITLFSKDTYLLLFWAAWNYPLSLKSILILYFHLHAGQLRNLYSSIFRTTLIHPLIHTCCMPCPFYPPCPSHPKIIRRRAQIKNHLTIQFHISYAKISSLVLCARIPSTYFRLVMWIWFYD
jgi:hypothetical protein